MGVRTCTGMFTASATMGSLKQEEGGGGERVPAKARGELKMRVEQTVPPAPGLTRA